jgi:hypothetical protein
MNERIRQFARESHLDVYALGLDKVKWEATLEKFAELIVSDIVGAIRGLQLSAQEDGMLNVAATCDTLAELIEIDYGIKE